MKNIRIVFERDKGIVPWLIRYFTSCPYNHVGIEYVSEDWNEPWIVEAVKSGTRNFPVKPHRKWVRAYEVLYDGADRDLRALSPMIGLPYDYEGLVVFGFCKMLVNWFKMKVWYPKVTYRGELCSEIVAEFLMPRFGKPAGEPQWVSPADIDAFCAEQVLAGTGNFKRDS